jgi:hypothetical protein
MLRVVCSECWACCAGRGVLGVVCVRAPPLKRAHRRRCGSSTLRGEDEAARGVIELVAQAHGALGREHLRVGTRQVPMQSRFALKARARRVTRERRRLCRREARVEGLVGGHETVAFVHGAEGASQKVGLRLDELTAERANRSR